GVGGEAADMSKGIVRIAALLALLSCGSSANKMTGTGSDGGTCPISRGSIGSASWKDDGTPFCGFGASVARSTTTAADRIQIAVSTRLSQSVDIVVTSYSRPLGGTYSCQPGNGTTAPAVIFDYVGTHGGGFAKISDCSVTFGFSEDSA